jgi:hypothetical protein
MLLEALLRVVAGGRWSSAYSSESVMAVYYVEWHHPMTIRFEIWTAVVTTRIADFD